MILIFTFLAGIFTGTAINSLVVRHGLQPENREVQKEA